MKTTYKKILCLLTAAVILFCFCGCEETDPYPKPTEKFFINDFASVIDDESENLIYKAGVQLNKKTGAQVVAVTVETTDNEEIGEYALELGRKWEIGEKEKNNGVLILLASEDRNIYIAVGYGLEGALPDSKTGRLLDVYAIPYLKQDDFSKGLSSVYSAVVNEVYIENGIEPTGEYIPIDQIPDTQEKTTPASVLISWIIMIVIIVVLNIFFRGRMGFPLFFFFGGPKGGGGSGGFGGFSGGGFSGGGGSFGGGGAGRSF